MDATALLFVVVALGVGALIGWLLGSRDGASAKQTVESLRLQLDEVVKERDDARSAGNAASRELAALQADARNFDQRMKDLADSRDALIGQFRAVGDQLLEKAQKDFLEKAGERFSRADQQTEAKLKTLLQPVESTLKRYEEGLQRVEKERVDHYAGLREAVDLVRTGQSQVRDEARRLVTALTSSPKQRGRWGEKSLENVLTMAGLVKGVDFNMEVSVEGDDGRLRPDAIINLPEGRKLVVDAKCSLNAYLDACDQVDDDKKAECFKAHLASIVRHSQQLGSKTYWAQFGDAAEFVVMYIPGEHFLSAALEQDEELWERAFRNRVLLATPTNLVAIARTVATVWNQQKLAAEAKQIAELGRELHARLATMIEHIASVGTNLGRATNAYNKLVGSLESRVLTQARKFESHGAGSAKALETPSRIEQNPLPVSAAVSAAGDQGAFNASNDDPTQIAAE